ncbi:PREDICTED: protein transport protein SEC31 homolog B isoform X3 [Camelina sativa]|uniref:Protein transport protein SEC31 homolog B isoform X3 n=1 Tax=Camelina sativa TaxID=90675 RepID=A0ABM0ZAJ7_CAMSA|nr:PREDICTED: protein transport protein SEC31 homolog B isoform X3 [Camelina sativa]
MACIKGVGRSASIALSPDAPYMAAGTMAGAVDLSFSSSANLEIFKLDFQSDDRDLPLVGEIPSSERFNRLAWGKSGSGSEEFSLGLIAGGLVDGNIDLWNPLSLIGSSQSSESALVGHLSVHKGPVRGLDFNVNNANLLASGADDGEICIWDLVKPSEPSHFPILKGNGSASQGEISFISWNRKVQQILASTSYNGNTVIWDLRKQKPIIHFADSVRRRCSVLQWNPDIATQIIVASDDDSSPSFKLWDMRNILEPVHEFIGHQRGVIAMEWCPSDSSYLLTCAKDNRTICWDTNTAEIVAELPAGSNWNFDVHWYPKIPGVISASSFDGKIGIYNIEGCSRYGAEENNFATAPLRAPKWYKRPVGASFGFGGKLVSCHAKAPPPKGASSILSEVFLHSLVTEQSLVSRTSEFEAAIENGDKTSLRGLCEKKSEETESEEEKETWGLLKIMFEEEEISRTKLISHLGFTLPIEEKDQAVNGLSSDLNGIRLEDTVAHALEPEDSNEAAAFAMDNGEDFFNNFPAKPDTPVSTSAKEFMPPDTDFSVKGEETQEVQEEEEESSDPVFDNAIQRALVVGDYKEAVDQCISANKMADALVIAHVGGTELWESTREKYLKTSSAPYMKVVSAMVNNDLRSLIYTRSHKFWKETLALLCTFAQGEQWTTLCDALASKLMAAGNTLAAVLCYICAGNVDRTVEIWSRSLANERDGRSYAELLQDLMEKTLVLALATGNKRFSASLCKLFESYAEILASQGLLTTAMKYLKVLDSGGLSPELSILRDRISMSAEPETDPAASVNTQPQSTVPYNQESTQAQPNVLANQYDNQYQQPYTDSYNPYVPQASHPPMQQPTMFMPHQAQPAPQPSFTPASNAQPSMRTTFVPSTPPALKNADQYQQPTMSSHTFTGPSHNAYPAPPGHGPYAPSGPSQFGQYPNPQMPQVNAPAPGSIGFTPMATPGGVAPRSVQPASPPTQQAAPTPAAPPPTVQTADTSNVPAHQKPVIATLTRLFNETSEALGGARANPAKKREIEDNSKKLGALFVKLNSGDISKNAADKLAQLCQALDSNDFSAALQIQVLLTTKEWDECNFWLATLKRMIKTRQNVR